MVIEDIDSKCEKVITLKNSQSMKNIRQTLQKTNCLGAMGRTPKQFKNFNR